MSNLKSSNIDDNEMEDKETVVVLGGGFGGLCTALTLSTLLQSLTVIDKSSSGMKIKLIDSKERFVFLPLLYELCIDKISLDEVAPTYKDLLVGSNVEFVQAEVTGFDAELCSVLVTNSSTFCDSSDTIQGDACVKYDKLVIATGNAPPTVDRLESRLPGASYCKSSICTFYTIDDCYDLRRRLTYLQNVANADETLSPKKKNIVIVGAGYSGVEVASNLAADDENNLFNVTLIHKGNNILSDATQYNRMNAEAQLQKLGVNVMTNTIVSKVSNCNVDNEEEEEEFSTAYPPCMLQIEPKGEELFELQADTLIWTAGGGRNTIKDLSSSLPIYENGKIVVNEKLNTRKHATDNLNDGNKHIFALGDISQLVISENNETKILPQTAQKAIQQAYTIAWNIFSHYVNTNIITKINEQDRKSLFLLPMMNQKIPLLPQISFDYINLGEILTLGTKDATVSSLGGLVQINGTTGGIARRLIYSIRMPTQMQALLSIVKNLNRFLLLGDFK